MEIIIGITVIAIIILVVVFFKVGDTSVKRVPNNKITANKLNKPIVKERSFPWFYVKECKFYANTSSIFSYDQKDLEFLMEKYDEYEKTADYEEVIKICDEIIEINYKIRKVWIDKINALFNLVIKSGKEWDESTSKLIINACYGFMKTFDNTLERSIGVKHILIPILLKNSYNIIEYQRKNLSEIYNFELYNMLMNLFYLMPFHILLDNLYRYLTEDKFSKVFEQSEYAKRSIKSLLGHIEMLKNKYKINDVEYNSETSYKVKINDNVIINDEIFNTTWVGFSVTFPVDTKQLELTCKFYDERFQEIFLDSNTFKRYSDLFETKILKGGIEKYDIVVLGEDRIRSVDLSIYRGEEFENNAVLKISKPGDIKKDGENGFVSSF